MAARNVTSRPELTQARLKELLHYDPETGIFTWRVIKSNKISSDLIAGTAHSQGYISIGIDRKHYLAHRLAFLYMQGSWPINDVDHKNGKRNENVWKNLRQSTRTLNLENQRAAHKNNIYSGLLGAYKCRNRWQAKIQTKGQCIFIGAFATAMEAHLAYVDAKRKLHEGCTI